VTGTSAYHGTREELLREINETKSIVHAPNPLHEDPVEDIAIRGIWSALLETLLRHLAEIDPELAAQAVDTDVNFPQARVA